MLVCGAANVRISNTTVRPHCVGGDAFGILVMGTGSLARLWDCQVGSPDKRCRSIVVATAGAAVEAQGCEIGGCFKCCVAVKGTGTGAELVRCRIHDCGANVVLAQEGAKVEMDRCEVCGSEFAYQEPAVTHLADNT